MEDKIEVGEYIRLARNQGINKIIEIEDNKYILDTDIADEWGDLTCTLEKYQLKDEIVKHSKNLIDLIEENDILEYQLFGKPKVDRVKKYKDGRTGEEMLLIEGFKLSNAKILSATTHEQFEAMKYKAGDD